MRENTSAPMTSALLAEPVLIMASAIVSATGYAQLVLQDTGSRREHHVRRGRGHDDEVNVGGLQAGRVKGPSGGFGTQVAAGHIGGGEMTGVDAGALYYPFVGGFNTLGGQFGCKVCIAQAPRREKAAGASDA